MVDLNPIHYVEKGADKVADALGAVSGAQQGIAGKATGGGDGISPAPGKFGVAGSNAEPATANSISTEGLKENGNYTYKNGKLTEYTPAASPTAASEDYGFDPLSMQLIFSKVIGPALQNLQGQYNSEVGGSQKALNADYSADAASGVSPAAIDILKTAGGLTNQADKANYTAQTESGLAQAPYDALITQLGQSADAARLAGYEAEYGQAAGSSGSSTAGTDALAQILAATGGTTTASS